MNTTGEKSTPLHLIDFEQLQSACDGDLGLMRELMGLYFQQGDEIMAALNLAIEAGSIPDVDHLAHKLAGSSLACGMSAIVPALRRLEHGAKSGHLNGARESYAEAAQYLELIRQAVQNHLQEKSDEHAG